MERHEEGAGAAEGTTERRDGKRETEEDSKRVTEGLCRGHSDGECCGCQIPRSTWGTILIFTPFFFYPCCDGAGFLNTFNINYFSH